MYTGISANERKEGARNMEINEQNFGENYHLITITNQNGTSLSVSDLGARVVHFQTIIDNEKRELILGFDEAKEYLEKDPLYRCFNRTYGWTDYEWHIQIR